MWNSVSVVLIFILEINVFFDILCCNIYLESYGWDAALILSIIDEFDGEFTLIYGNLGWARYGYII